GREAISGFPTMGEVPSTSKLSVTTHCSPSGQTLSTTFVIAEKVPSPWRERARVRVGAGCSSTLGRRDRPRLIRPNLPTLQLRMDQPSENLQAIDNPRPGPRKISRSVNRIDLPGPHRRQFLPEWGQRHLAEPFQHLIHVVPARRKQDHLRPVLL